jgi:hypothetical protein
MADTSRTSIQGRHCDTVTDQNFVSDDDLFEA